MGSMGMQTKAAAKYHQEERDELMRKIKRLKKAMRNAIKQLQAENKRLKEDKPKEPDVDLKTAIAQFSRIMHLFEIKNPKQGQLVEMKRRLNNLFWHLQALKDK